MKFSNPAGVPPDVAEQLLDAPVGQAPNLERRSDPAKSEAIRRCLEQLDCDTGDVRISVLDGTVHLDGSVASAAAESDVLDRVAQCSGGLALRSELVIRSPDV